jgi:hypothetical protein
MITLEHTQLVLNSRHAPSTYSAEAAINFYVGCIMDNWALASQDMFVGVAGKRKQTWSTPLSASDFKLI